MKKTILASILAVGFIGSAIACSGSNCNVTTPNASAAATNKVISGSAVGGGSYGNGGSISYAANSTKSAAGVTAFGSTSAANSPFPGRDCTTSGYAAGNTGVSGYTNTSSESVAWNKSAGAGTGFAAAGGLGQATASGSGTYGAGTVGMAGIGLVGGTAAGASSSLTANGVIAGRNEFGAIDAGNNSGFSASADSRIDLTAKYGFFKVTKTDTKVANTEASGYSHSGTDQIGNATIGGVNGGIYAAGAASFANGTLSTAGLPR